MFTIKLLSQHVSGIIMPIIRRTRPCITAYGVLHWLCWLWLCVELGRKLCALCERYCSNSNVHTVHTAPHNHSQHNRHRTSYAVTHSLVLLTMGIMMPETCRDRSLIINIGLFASWFISLHSSNLFIFSPCSFSFVYLLFLLTHYNFDVWLTVHRNSVWIRKPTRCHFLYSLFLF